MQGLADVFFMLNIAYESKKAKKLNKQIFETIYFGAMEASMELARDRESEMKEFKTEMEKSGFVSENILRDINKRLKPIDRELDRDEYLGTYSSYIGSPMYTGKLQFDLWGIEVSNELFDWKKRKASD